MITEFIPGIFEDMRAKFGNEGSDPGPVEITHLFRFRDQAYYENGSDLPPVSGRDAYFNRYLPAILKIAQDHLPSENLAQILYAGDIIGATASPEDEAWDYIVVIAWPDFEHPYILDTVPAYESDAAPHRRAALVDFRVLVSRKFLPNI